jgi:hypothetical protein
MVTVCWAVGACWAQEPVELKGTVGCAKCAFAEGTKATECAAVLKVGEKYYYFKTADKAPKPLTEMLKKITSGTLKGDYTAKGTESTDDNKKEWLTVTSLTPVKATTKKGGSKKH